MNYAPFVGPMPLHYPASPRISATGHNACLRMSSAASFVLPAYHSDFDSGPIDAPDFLPSGGARVCSYGSFSLAGSIAHRCDL